MISSRISSRTPVVLRAHQNLKNPSAGRRPAEANELRLDLGRTATNSHNLTLTSHVQVSVRGHWQGRATRAETRAKHSGRLAAVNAEVASVLRCSFSVKFMSLVVRNFQDRLLKARVMLNAYAHFRCGTLP